MYSKGVLALITTCMNSMKVGAEAMGSNSRIMNPLMNELHTGKQLQLNMQL